MELANFIWTNGLSFIFILTVIVFVHEMGHYLIARYNGVRVEVFAIGFGPELYGWDGAAGTRWKICLFPLGGYVKMFGDAGAASTPSGEVQTMTPEEKAVSFHHKRLGQRMAIVLGGPLANFALALVILAIMFATVGQRIIPTDITAVAPNSAAEAAGMQPGDTIVAIEGATIDRFETVQRIVRESPGMPLRFVVLRDDVEVEFVVLPRFAEVTDSFGNQSRAGHIGVSRSGKTVYLRRGPLDAIWFAADETVSLTTAMLRALGQIVAGTRGTEELGGPIRVAQLSAQVAEDGLITVFWFLAVVSINLGLVNLFPIPMLDGGHLLFYVCEAIRGKPLGERVQEYGFRMGLVLVVSLMVFATWNDLVDLKVVNFVAGLFS